MSKKATTGWILLIVQDADNKWMSPRLSSLHRDSYQITCAHSLFSEGVCLVRDKEGCRDEHLRDEPTS